MLTALVGMLSTLRIITIAPVLVKNYDCNILYLKAPGTEISLCKEEVLCHSSKTSYVKLQYLGKGCQQQQDRQLQAGGITICNEEWGAGREQFTENILR